MFQLFGVKWCFLISKINKKNIDFRDLFVSEFALISKINQNIDLHPNISD